MRKDKGIFLALLFSLIWGVVYSQSSSAMLPDKSFYETGQKLLQETIAELDNILFSVEKNKSAVIPSLFTQQRHPLNDVALKAINEAAKASITSLRRPDGLEFQAGYTYSGSVGHTIMSDIDEDWSYRNKYQFTLSWDFRQFNMFGRKIKSELINHKAELDQMRVIAQYKRSALQEILNSTLEKYDAYLLSILNNRIYIHDVLLFLNEGFYRTGDIPIDRLFDISYKKKTLEGLRETLSASVPSTDIYDDDAFVFYHIDENKYEQLLSGNEAVAINAKEWEMEKKKGQQFSYWNEVRVIPFVRYQYLNYAITRPDVSNGQAGLNIVLPLYNKAKHDKLQSNKQQVILRETLRQQEALVQRQGIDYINSYRRTDQRLKTLLWDMQRYENEFRIWKYKDAIDNISTNGVKVIEMLDKYLESLYTFYAIRIDYERQLQNIKHLAADEDFASFVSLSYVDRKSAIITKPLSAYVWSKQHAEKKWDDIVFMAKSRQIDRLYIGYNQNLPKTHYRNFITLLSRNRITSYLCVSNTELIQFTPRQINEYLQNFNNITGLTGLHLDIEPHQFYDWTENKVKYLNDFLSLLSIVKEYAVKNRLDLTIALPATYPQTFYEEITSYVSGITLMIYKSDLQATVETMQRIVSQAVSKKQIELAIRPEDYIPDYIQAISKLNENELVSSVALESLATLNEVVYRKPAIQQVDSGNYTLSFFEEGKARQTVITGFKSYKEAVTYFGNLIKDI